MNSDLGESWRQLATETWKKPTTRARKVRTDIVKTKIWDPLEKEQFSLSALALLEGLGLLEEYLWPGYTEEATNHHALLIAMLVNAKRRQGLAVWDIFADRETGDFAALFRRILSLSVDDSLSAALQIFLLDFLITAFQSLDNGLVRKQCAPLVSVSIWTHLHSDGAREAKFEEHTPLRKAWRASVRRYDAADGDTKARLEFERDWLYSLILGFLRSLHTSPISTSTMVYCEKFLEFLTDLESQLPTRRYVNALIQDLNLLAAIKFSPVFRQGSNGLLHDLFQLLRHYVWFAINDHTGRSLSISEAYEIHAARLAQLQRVALKHFKSRLTLLALSNYSVIEKRADMAGFFAELSDDELADFVSKVRLRTDYPASAEVTTSRDFLLEVIISNFERHKTYQEVVRDLSVLPTEEDLYEPSLLRNESYDGSHSLALPKLNLQYLSVGDFLWRSFILYRCESFFEIRNEMEETVKRVQPRLTVTREVQFGGFSKMALPINKPGILEIAQPKVGMASPAFVRAEVTLDLARLAENVRHDWDMLKPGDVLYLLAVKPDRGNFLMNGDSKMEEDSRERAFKHLRTAEVVQMLEESGKAIRDVSAHANRGHIRRVIVNLDPAAYYADTHGTKETQGVYEELNLVIRRKGRENNFKRVLESIKSLTLSHAPLPHWLRDVFLGFGDPASATYTRLANKLKSVDYRDTFLDWTHLKESLPERVVEADDSQSDSFSPPYVLQEVDENIPREPPTKKRKQNANPEQSTVQKMKVSTYKPPNKGPYPEDVPQRNQVRFTPAQVEAIMSGTQPGLTIVVGPPGTGKTDVATQIINNLYHDFPEQRTLLIAHSNQALNQLFQKITKLDIDDRHLLRLGHGEEELDTEANYGKSGRVESFLDNRTRYLDEVNRLAANLGAPGAHGQSCETADYFQSVYIAPTWARFWDEVEGAEDKAATIRSAFPFYKYFSNAPNQPLFPEGASDDNLLEVVHGCQSHIDKIFTELEDIRPFEIVRSARDRANYLLIKEARVIAMTSTHAAMRRQEIADTGFHYDNVVMEEAAQITEIENFIPLALQHTRDGELPLKRVVLCGDHLQNSPVVQNLAFRQFSNLEQSMFLRLVRLGVPVINLDQQGRSRPSIAELYRWRYQNLGDLPSVLDSDEYRFANPGFRYDYQFIDVGDYKGAGEKQPTPHFIQNLGEAEYAVAIYQYMRLLGYPASKISILTTYAGQRALISDVLNHRCRKNRLFGMPKIVTTVDKYQGEQNDYVILSLVRTNRIGYLRDVRRLTVALSRARLGLYILGRQELFETCHELAPAFKALLQWPTTLMVVPGEVAPTTRAVDADTDATPITGVEHLGQYVYEMTQAKIAQLKSGNAPELLKEPMETNDEAADAEEAEIEAVAEQPEELEP